MSVDELDRQILRLLHRDGRLPYSTIARQLDSNEATIRKRVQRLIQDSVLEIIGVSNPYRLGLETHVMIGIEVELRALDAVVDQLSTFEELNFVAASSGEFDIVVVGVFASELEFYEFLTQKLANVDGIRATRTSHLLRVARRTFNYRIPDQQPARRDDVSADVDQQLDGRDGAEHRGTESDSAGANRRTRSRARGPMAGQ